MPQSKEANGIVSIAHQRDKQHIPCQQTKHVENLLSLTQDEATHELANQEIVDRPDNTDPYYLICYCIKMACRD